MLDRITGLAGCERIKLEEAMRNAMLMQLVLAMVLSLLITDSAMACPACNIHNYLASTVRNSKNIFIGEVLAQVDKRTAEVKVIKVFRGDNKVDSTVRHQMFNTKEYIGKKFIFCDPAMIGASFDILPVEYEDEVQFLMQEKPSVANIDEAVKRVQGVSRETHNIGMEYIKNHHDTAVKPLIKELNTLVPQVFSSEKEYFGEYRLEQLLKALFLKPSAEGQEFAISQIEEYAKQVPPEIDWKIMRYRPSPRGEFLKELLSQTRNDPKLSELAISKMEQVYPKLSGLFLAEANFAMLLSGVAKSEKLQSSIKDESSSDMLALGLFLAGNEESSAWQHAAAYKYWENALMFAKKKELKDRIEDSIKRAEKLNSSKINSSIEANSK